MVFSIAHTFLFVAPGLQSMSRTYFTVDMCILSYCLQFHFDWHEYTYCRKLPTIPKFLSIIITIIVSKWLGLINNFILISIRNIVYTCISNKTWNCSYIETQISFFPGQLMYGKVGWLRTAYELGHKSATYLFLLLNTF